jgi:phosphoribosylformimino-5-aminoimidazole carboxamide ribotide isomerase
LAVILIPVIDLSAGRVVHARGGERSNYRPLQSQLCRSSQPLQVVAGLLSLHPFTRLYIADLDAITRTGDNTAVISQLHAAFPGLQLWVDTGISIRSDLLLHRARCPGTAVVGSETLADTALLQTSVSGDDTVLSLDFRHGLPLGPTDIPAHPELWPGRVIVMSLDRTGSDRGPDLARLRQLRRDAPHCELFAAGGIRDADDLEQLQDLGVTGALLASALHEGRIDAGQLRHFT